MIISNFCRLNVYLERLIIDGQDSRMHHLLTFYALTLNLMVFSSVSGGFEGLPRLWRSVGKSEPLVFSEELPEFSGLITSPLRRFISGSI